jgi:dipeptide/tripeptide permease
VGALFFIGAIGLGVARFSFGVFFDSLQDSFGWSRASTSGVFSAYTLLCALFTILGGWL